MARRKSGAGQAALDLSTKPAPKLVALALAGPDNICELPPEDPEPPARRPSEARVALRRKAFAELVTDYHGKMAADWAHPHPAGGRAPDRFALVQRVRDANGARHWLSTWETPEEAAAYLTEDDSGFAPLSLVDLETGDEFEPIVATHFRLVVS